MNNGECTAKWKEAGGFCSSAMEQPTLSHTRVPVPANPSNARNPMVWICALAKYGLQKDADVDAGGRRSKWVLFVVAPVKLKARPATP